MCVVVYGMSFIGCRSLDVVHWMLFTSGCSLDVVVGCSICCIGCSICCCLWDVRIDVVSCMLLLVAVYVVVGCMLLLVLYMLCVGLLLLISRMLAMVCN